MRTKNGIELNLYESCYSYQFKDYRFYFSSLFNMKRYVEKLKDYINFENSKIIAKYHVDLYLEIYLAISLYKQIEKRGFLIFDVNSHEYIKDNIFFEAYLINRS